MATKLSPSNKNIQIQHHDIFVSKYTSWKKLKTKWKYIADYKLKKKWTCCVQKYEICSDKQRLKGLLNATYSQIIIFGAKTLTMRQECKIGVIIIRKQIKKRANLICVPYKRQHKHCCLACLGPTDFLMLTRSLVSLNEIRLSEGVHKKGRQRTALNLQQSNNKMCSGINLRNSWV